MGDEWAHEPDLSWVPVQYGHRTQRSSLRAQEATCPLRRPSLPRLTCPVACAVEVHGEGAALVLGLPGGGGAILVVGVGVMVVDVLAGEDGGSRRAAHGCGHEGVDEVCPALLHDAPRLVHHLHGACEQRALVSHVACWGDQRRGPPSLSRAAGRLRKSMGCMGQILHPPNPTRKALASVPLDTHTG